MKVKLDSLKHGMLLDAKKVIDSALPELSSLFVLIPERLHDEAKRIIREFEDTLCACAVSEKTK